MPTAPTKRLKPAPVLALRNRSEAEAEASKLALLQTQIETLVAARDAAQMEAARPFATQLEPLNAALTLGLNKIELWAEANPHEFGDLKSTTLAGHRVGWQLGNWATKLLSKVTWANVLNTLKLASDSKNMAEAATAARFLRVVEEPNKQAMIEARIEPETFGWLHKLGVTFAQAERFYFEPNREGQAPSTITS